MDPAATPRKHETKKEETMSGATSSKTAASSATTATTPTGVRKAIVKQRELRCKNSAESDSHKRDLTKDVEKAKGDDKELMSDAEMKGTAGQPQSSSSGPAGNDEFWSKMSMMLDFKLDAKIDTLSKNVAGAFNAVEVRLGERITAEEERWHKEVLGTNTRVHDVMERLEALELRENRTTPRTEAAGPPDGGRST